MYLLYPRKLFKSLVTVIIITNKFNVDKNKTRALIIKVLFLNFTGLLITLKSC